MAKIILLLIFTIVGAQAKDIDKEIERTASTMICYQTRWEGLSQSRILQKTFTYRIGRHDGQIIIGSNTDFYDFTDGNGLSYIMMVPLHDGRLGVREYGFLPIINDSQNASNIRAEFIGKIKKSFKISRRTCAEYSREESMLKTRMQIAAIISVNNFMRLGTNLEISNITKEKICSFNESDPNIHIVIERENHKIESYVVAIHPTVADFSKTLETDSDLVVRQLYDPEASDVAARC